MNEDLNSLHAAISNANFDIGSLEEFSIKMQTPGQRKSFFDAMATQNVDLGDYNEYETKLGGFPDDREEEEAKDKSQADVAVTEENTASSGEESSTDSRLPFEYSDDEKTDVLLRKKEVALDPDGNPELDEYGNEKTNLVTNKDFFDLEDEVAVSQLEAQFGEAFDFKEMRFGKFKGAGVSMSGVTVSTKDGRESKTIEFNIDSRDQPTDEMINTVLQKQKNDPSSLNHIDKRVLRQVEDNKNAYEIAYNDLVFFMDKNSTDKTTAAVNKKEHSIRKTVSDFNNYVRQDIEAIETSYSEEAQPNMFEPVEEEVTQRFAYGMEAKGGGGSRTYTKVTYPYKEELKLAMTRLGVDEITQEVKDEARNIVIENERRSLKEAKTAEMLEELEDGEILPASLAEYENDTDALKAVLTVGGEMFQEEYARKTEAFIREKHELETNEDILAFTNLSKQLNDPEYNFEIPGKKELDNELTALGVVDENSSQEKINAYNDIVKRYEQLEPVVVLEDGREILKSTMDQYEKERLRLKPKYENFFKLQNDLIDSRYNIQDSKTQLDLLRRDYDDFERFGVTIGTGFAELAINIGGATEDIKAHKRWAKVKSELQKKRDEYAKPMAYDDAFNSWASFGKFAVGELGNQIPIFTALAVPYAGWGTLLASSYGEQYGTMTAEEIASDGMVDYSLFEKIGVSAGYAVPELAFELLTTVPLLRGAGNALKGVYGSSIRDLTRQGVYEGIRANTPGFIKGSLFGSLGEGATTLTQNVVTGKPWHENVEHSLFSGLMFESTIAAVPTVAGAIVNKLSDYTENAKVRENLIVVNSIVQANKILKRRIKFGKKLNKDTELLESDKKNNENKIKDLLADNTKILQEQKQGITGRWLGWGKNNKEGMSAGAFKAYLNVTTQQEQLRLQADKIINSDYADAEKSKRLKELKENGFTDASGRKYNGFDLLQGARDAFRSEKNSEFNLWKADKNNEEKLNEYLEKAKDFIDNPNTDRSPSWAKGQDADNVARILFNIDKINENLSTARDKKGRPTALDKNLVVYDNVEDAVLAMAKLGIDNEVIQSVKDGSHGFDGPQNKSYIIVENMAKDDRLETKTHELSHRFFRNAIAENPEAFREMSETIFEWSKANDQKLYARLLRQEMTVDSAPDEIIAVFLEEAAAERINLKKKGIAGIIGYMTGNVIQEGYGVDMDFAGESDAIKMLIGLGKKIKAGKLTLKDQEAIVENQVFETAKRKGKILDLFMPKVPGATKLSQAEGSQTTVKADLFTETNDALIEALEMYGMDRPERLLSEDIEVRKELAKEWEALGDSKFWIGIVVGEKWRKFIEVNYLSKRDKAANYELYKDQILDVAATGIESGDNGIPFLVKAWKPAEEGGRTLTSHIYGQIETRLMATDGIIDRRFPQLDKFTSQIDGSFDDGGIDIESDLDIDTVLEMERRKEERKKNLEEDRYRKLIGIDDKFAVEIKKEIRDVLLSGKLGLISEFDWTQRFSKAAQKKLFTVIKKEMKDYEVFLKKTRKPFVRHAHTSDLVQMEKNEKKKIFTTLKAINASPTKIKLALLEGLIQPFEIKSMTQGPNVYGKVDTKEQEFIDFMKVRGRKDALVNNNINIMAMDAVFDVLLNETIEVDGVQVRVLDEFIRQQREKGLPHASNVLSIIKERINRDQDVKFSSTVRNFNNFDLRLFYGKLDIFGGKIDLINVGDEDAVRLAVEETWIDEEGNPQYSKTVIKALFKDLFKLVKRYATIDKNHTNLKTQPEKKLNEYLYDNLKAAELELNLAEYLELKDENGRLMKFSELFDNTSRLNNQRSAIIDFGKKLIGKYGKEKALMMMIHAGGMYSTSTQISRGNHVVNEGGKIYKITEDQITKLDKEGRRKTQFSSQRYQSFTGKKDWNKNVMQVVFPELKFTEAGNLGKFQTLDGVVDKEGRLKKIDTSLLAESSKKGMEDRNFVGREAQAKLSEEFVKDIAQYYKDNKALDKVDFGMLMMSMSSNMQSPLKRAANLKYIYRDKKGKKYKGEFRYEHMIPTNFMVLKITDAYTNDKSDVDLDALFKEYTVAIIPSTMDKVMEEMNFINTMPIGFGAGQSSRIRYYNMSTFGHPDLYAIESLDPSDNGRVYGEGIANIKLSGSIEKSRTLSKAAKFSISVNNPTKGITVLDFDDTLATSKSGVQYTLPNPDGTPQPNKKVIFLAGGAGSGKGGVIKQLGLKEQGYKIVNSDISLEWLKKNHGLPENMNDLTPEQLSELGKLQWQAREIAAKKKMKYQGDGDGVVVDGTGGSLKVMQKQVQEFKDKGYDVQMVFVETSIETAVERNVNRAERSLREGIVRRNHESVQANKEGFKELFGNNFAEVKTDNIKQGDAMPTALVTKMDAFTKGYSKGRLNPGEFATKGASLLEQGAKFDFSEFNKVVEGQTAPLFEKAMKLQKKFGNKDMFVLTARPAESAQAIFEFLQANGLNIPLKNITGLANSTAEAKALWMADKVGEGYNDFYFADDALQNVKAVDNMLEQFDVKRKVQQARADFVKGDPQVVKLLEESSINDVKDVGGLANPGTYNNIKFSKNHRAEYENTIAKYRPDLVRDKLVSKTVDNMFDFIDNLDVPNDKKRKYERITTKWLATSNVKLGEDAYKIKQAVELAEKHKEDIFSYKNPNEIIEKYAGKTKEKPTNPKTVKEFGEGRVFNEKHGITVHEVEDTKEGMMSVRKVADTHWGPKSNPWCIIARSEKPRVEPRQHGYESVATKSEAQARKQQLENEGFIVEITTHKKDYRGKYPGKSIDGERVDMRYELDIKEVKEGPGIMDDAWQNWTVYGKSKKYIVFQNGRLSSFYADNQYWDRMDSPTDAPVIQIKEGRVTSKVELVPIGDGKVDEFVMETRTVSKDKKTVTTEILHETQDGYEYGTKIIENRVNGVTVKSTRSRPGFDKQGNDVTQVQEIINFDKSGKATSNMTFDADGTTRAVNRYGTPFGDMTKIDIIMKKGDLLSLEMSEGGVDYYHGDILLDGKRTEIGWQAKEGTFDLVDATKIVDGGLRVDLKKVLEVDPDVKGLPKTGVKFSKSMDQNLNDILEQTTGVESKKVFSDAQAKIRGHKSKYKSIIPPSAQDFVGLLYNFLGKGKKGEQDMAFFKKALIDPFARGINELNTSKQSAANDYTNLQKAFPDVKKIINKKIKGLEFTNDQAARVYLWNKAGFEVPGLSQRDLKTLVDHVESNPSLQAFADGIGLISKKEEGYSKPGDYWLAENITSDLLSDGAIGEVRASFLTEWQENADQMFSTENLNKIEAIYGSNFREALEDILYRMKTGRNRPTGSSRIMNGYMNWVNNSVGAIMFINVRSATLQTISATNYINWTDNNPLKAAAAFANQPQYWDDFSMIWNSPYLKQRRSGNQRGINEAELSAAVAGAQNKALAALNYLLKKGFTPTQLADSFAISLGGASFYRNRVKKYTKQGMTQEQAETKAFLDFQETTEVSQQSARPDMISQQQASPLGRLILSFMNTPMQYARVMNKATRDLTNGRGDYKTHISKIVYYGFVQSIIFGALQSALYASLGWDDDDEEDLVIDKNGVKPGKEDYIKTTKNEASFDKKKERILNQMVDSWLTGIGYGGKAISTVKNTVMEFLKQRDKGFKADHTYTILTLLSFSPPIGSKLRKIYGSIQTEQFNRGVFEKRGMSLDNPLWSGVGHVIEGTTNVPLGRISNIMLQVDNALDSSHEWWQRVALVLGQNTWDLDIEDPDIKAAKAEVKEEKKVASKEKAKVRKEEKKVEKAKENVAVIEENKKKSKKDGVCSAVSSSGERCSNEVVGGKSFCTVHEKATQRKDGKETQCRKRKKDGKRCGMKTTSKSGFCYYHD